MQVLNGQYELGDDEASSMLSEVVTSSDQFCEITEGAVVKGHVEVAGSLKGVVQIHDKRAVNLFEDGSLTNCIL